MRKVRISGNRSYVFRSNSLVFKFQILHRLVVLNKRNKLRNFWGSKTKGVF